MSVSFEEALAITEREVARFWTPPGVLYVDPDGWESASEWMVTAGAREWLKDGDISYRRADDAVNLVNKETGAFRRVSPLGRARHWEPVSARPT